MLIFLKNTFRHINQCGGSQPHSSTWQEYWSPGARNPLSNLPTMILVSCIPIRFFLFYLVRGMTPLVFFLAPFFIGIAQEKSSSEGENHGWGSARTIQPPHYDGLPPLPTFQLRFILQPSLLPYRAIPASPRFTAPHSVALPQLVGAPCWSAYVRETPPISHLTLITHKYEGLLKSLLRSIT
jgi:hypothetical protein